MPVLNSLIWNPRPSPPPGPQVGVCQQEERERRDKEAPQPPAQRVVARVRALQLCGLLQQRLLLLPQVRGPQRPSLQMTDGM